MKFIFAHCQLGGYIAAAIALLCTLTHENHWPAQITSGADGESQRDYFIHNYIKPWCRIQPYLVGILLGYALHKTKNKEIKIPKVILKCPGIAFSDLADCCD